MQMEQETLPLLLAGFSIVMLLSIGALIIAAVKRKNKSIGWFITQGVSQIISFYFAYSLLYRNYYDRPHPNIISEDNSVNIGLSAVFWAISMMLMVIGVYSASERRK